MHINQDPPENLLGVIRQKGDDVNNPDPTQFRHAYKHAALKSLLVAPYVANCESDQESTCEERHVESSPERTRPRLRR